MQLRVVGRKQQLLCRDAFMRAAHEQAEGLGGKAAAHRACVLEHVASDPNRGSCGDDGISAVLYPREAIGPAAGVRYGGPI